jgi:enoyl-CoA hydratase/carnithine racemase
MANDTDSPTGGAAASSQAQGSVAASFDGPVAEIVIANGPLNLVTRQLLLQFNDVLAGIVHNETVRCVILHGGTARAFCAGSNIKGFDLVKHAASERALEWGVVNQVVHEGTALEAARGLAATIAERGPLSNRLAKALVDAAQDVALDAGLSQATVAQQKIFDSQDLQEGAAAFLAKRSPSFRGA